MKKIRYKKLEIISKTKAGDEIIERAKEMDEDKKIAFLDKEINKTDFEIREYLGDTDEERKKNLIKKITNPFIE